MRKYSKFIDLDYMPRGDLIFLLRVDLKSRKNFRKTLNDIMLRLNKDLGKSDGRIFSIQGNTIKVAFPSEAFDENIPKIFGGDFGIGNLKMAYLDEVLFPKQILKKFQGPRYGVKGLRKKLRIQKRPLVVTEVSENMITKNHSEFSHESWLGGCDIILDKSPPLKDIKGFERRVSSALEMADKAHSETGERKAYFANVSGQEILKRIESLKSLGGNFAFVDIESSGWPSIKTLRESGLLVHAQNTFSFKNVNPIALAGFSRLFGADQIFLGASHMNLENNIKKIKLIKNEAQGKSSEKIEMDVNQDWYGLRPVMGILPGEYSPKDIPGIMKNFDNEIEIQPKKFFAYSNGTVSKAMRKAMNSVMNGEPLRFVKSSVVKKPPIRQW